MSKCSFFILLIAIIIAIIPLYFKKDFVKKFINGYGKKDDNDEEKKRFILEKKNNTMEEEIKNKYMKLKEDLINYKNNNLYLKFEKESNERIKNLEKVKKNFQDFERRISEQLEVEFQENEIKNLTDLIDRYILSET